MPAESHCTTPVVAAAPAAPPTTRATVHAGAGATHYVRAGDGRGGDGRGGVPVLLLCTRVACPLLASLASHFRVIAPELPCDAMRPADGASASAPAPSFASWLRDFLDGLGVARVAVVAEEAYALRALSFALTDPTRVDRIVLVFWDAPDPAVSAGALPELLERSGHPLLISCETTAGADGGGCGSIAGDLVAFLSAAALPTR